MKAFFAASAILLSLSLSTLAAAWDPSYGPHCFYGKDNTQIGQRPCLTSFIWCNTQGSNDDHYDCHFPPNVWPTTEPTYAGPPAVLEWYETYNISWKFHDPNYPVMISWFFANSTEESTLSAKWAVSTWPVPLFFLLHDLHRNTNQEFDDRYDYTSSILLSMDSTSERLPK